MTGEKQLWVTSMFGMKSQEPIVCITVPGGEMIQMSPADARAHAMAVLECAEAAETDAFLVDLVKNKLGIPDHGAAVMLQDFREWRERRRQP